MASRNVQFTDARNSTFNTATGDQLNIYVPNANINREHSVSLLVYLNPTSARYFL